MSKLDKIDIAMLRNLQSTGRMTNVELARNSGISAPPCLRRLKIMENDGIVVGYHATINPEMLGFGLKAICIVSLDSQKQESISDFIKKVKELPNVRFCSSTPGGETFILTIVAKDLKDYETILKNNIQNSDLVSNVKSHILVNVYKDEYGIPI